MPLLNRRTQLFVLLPLLVLGLVACAPKSRDKTSENKSQSPLTFVGDSACQPCHQAEFTSHEKSHHKSSLYDATKTALGDLAPPDGETASNFALRSLQDQLAVTIRLPNQTERSQVPLDLAIGSGKSGMTYMILWKDRSASLGQSYFPTEKKWHTTPGQEDVPKNQPGNIYNAKMTRGCLSCHVVTMPKDTLKPEKRFYGVGCESCHGEGSRHVTLMQAGVKSLKDIGMRSLASIGGTEMNEICGRCHSTAKQVLKMKQKEQKNTNRYQPYGLSLSKCFINSKNALSCSTCHNPHSDVETSEEHYDAACVACHNGQSETKKICPVNSTEKCASCHMPKRVVFPNTDTPTQMADHFIRIYKNSSLPKRAISSGDL
jgi:hypothetical protein